MWKMKIPNNLKTKKSKFAYMIFKNIYLFELGKNKVIGRPFTFLPEVGIVILLINQYFGKINPNLAISLLVVGVILAWFAGLLYYKLNLDKIETLVSQERNMLLKEMYEEVMNNGNNNRKQNNL